MVFGFPISVQLHPIQQHQAQASQALSILCWILKLRIQLLFIPVVGHGIDTSLNGDGTEERLRCTDSEMYWYVQWLVIYVHNCICSVYIYYYIRYYYIIYILLYYIYMSPLIHWWHDTEFLLLEHLKSSTFSSWSPSNSQGQTAPMAVCSEPVDGCKSMAGWCPWWNPSFLGMENTTSFLKTWGNRLERHLPK